MSPHLFEQPHHVGYQYLRFSLEDETFQTVMNTSYDLVIADELFVTAQGAMALKLREKFGTKFATMTTTDIASIYGMYRSIGRNPVINPSYYTKSYEVQNYDIHNFFGRLNTVWDAIAELYYINVAANSWLIKAGKLLDQSCSFKEIYQGSHATFMDYPTAFGFPASHSRSFVHIGEHCQKARELPSDLRQFVEDPTSKGTIYIAFGSIVDWDVAPRKVIASFFTVLNNLTDYRVIFTYSGPEVKDIKPHVKLLKWSPQNDILSHNKT
ncbi:unnamed protein product, partial [Cylicostephanus goldi]